MDSEIKSLLSWMFAWLGVPVVFSGIVYLTYRAVPPASFRSADWICIGLLFAFVVASTFWVREGLRPRQAWVAPVYAVAMGLLLFGVLGIISLRDV